MTGASTTKTAPSRGIFISAYAASPAYVRWDPVLESELLPGFCDLPGVVGLEVPWLGRIHPHDDGWFLTNVPAGAQLSLTPLPFVMQRGREDGRYGIASPDAAGRAAALADVRRLATDVRVLTDESEADVAFVGLHTAPAGAAQSTALAESLEEIADLDWCGAQLVVEHCDAAVPGRAFEKGFLLAADEIAAIAQADVAIGMWLNWGRSAIELRDGDAVTAQIADVAASGCLSGLTFSGAAGVDGRYGVAWSDAHLPILSTDPTSGSLLDDDRVGEALTAAGAVPWLGIKVSRRPEDRTATEVLRTVERNLLVVRDAWAPIEVAE